MKSNNQKNFLVAPKTADVLLRHAMRLKRSKDCNLLAHLDTIPDSESRAKLGPGWSSKSKIAKLAELQQALEELSSMTKMAMKQLEEEAVERHARTARKPGSTSSSSTPSSTPSSSRSSSPTLPEKHVPVDRNQRFREVASRFTSAANRKRFLEIAPHSSGRLPDDDDEVIRYRGPPRAPPKFSQKSLPAVPS